MSAAKRFNNSFASGVPNAAARKFVGNPTSSLLNFKSDSQIEMIKVYNLLGKVILSKEGKRMSQIDISELPKGIYLVEFEFKSAEKSVKRIVKE